MSEPSDLEKQLAELLTTNGELVGSIAHDIKGLLSGVNGGLYLAESGIQKDKPERVEQGFAMVRRNIARLSRTVGQSLYYVKQRDFSWRQLALGELLSNIANALGECAKQHAVSLQAEQTDLSCSGDELALTSLLSNIVEYALEGCAAGGRENPSVVLSSSKNGSEISIQVGATGLVLQRETIDRALAKTYMPLGTDRSLLGLYIAHRLVKALRGRFTISSDQQKTRTTFAVLLTESR